MTPAEHPIRLRALLRDKVHILPNTLARLPSQESQRLRSPLDLGRILLQPLTSSPEPLLQFWHAHPRGHAVIGLQRHGYEPGLQSVGRREFEAVAWVKARRLLEQPGLAEPLAHLLDHLLGSDGVEGGLWLSSGGGRNPAWAEVGRRLQRQAGLGYAPPEAVSSPHGYFFWGLRTFLLDRRALNTIDPGLERLLASTLFSAEFWRSAGDSV